MKKYRRLFFIAATVLLGASCGKVDALQERVDNIENRVEALEKVAATINGNIEALQAIASGQAINNVEEKDGTYVLTLSNGIVLTLQQGSIGMGKAPLMSIDKDGYWMVDYQDGNGATYITDDNGDKIVAVGQNGVTPMFGVSEDGYWTVSYNGGSSYTSVLDPSGNRVKAVAGSSTEDSYFAGVEYKDESLILTLKNGEQYSVPVVGGFLCKITGASDEEVFRKGEKKTFSVEQKGIASTIITAPKGWEAYLTNTVLSIQAPSDVETKAVLADTRADVAIVAISEAGHIAIAKVKVKVDGSISVYDPAASVALVEATVNSLKFNVTTENATSWYYMLRKAGETAPSAAELISGGTKGTEASVLVEGLMGQTEYVLYVLPCGDVSNGPIAAFKATTSDYSSMYEAWEAGVEITVGSQTYSKVVNGPGKLVPAGTDQPVYGAHVNGGTIGVYFLEEGASATLRNDAYTKSVIVIGNRPGTRPEVKFTTQIALEGAETDLALKNVTVSMADGMTGGKGIYNNKEIRKIILDDCYIDLKYPLAERHSSSKMAGLDMTDCDVLVDWASDNTALKFLISAHAGWADCGEMTVRNNVFWSKDGKKEFHLCASRYGHPTQFSDVVVENNTFYNVNNGIQSEVGRQRALVAASTVTSFSMSGNIAYDTKPESKGITGVTPHFTWLYTKNMTKEQVAAVIKAGTLNLMDIAEYCAYVASDGSEYSYGIKNLITWVTGGWSEVDSWENPFQSEDTANGVFKTKDTYKDYGAQR